MRILFTFAGGQGHFRPLVPLARAALAAGHAVAFGGQAGLLPAIGQAGFQGFDTGGVTFGDAARGRVRKNCGEKKNSSCHPMRIGLHLFSP